MMSNVLGRKSRYALAPVVQRRLGCARLPMSRLAPPYFRLLRLFFGCALLPMLMALAGCTPSIGDKCTLSTDCSIRGDRLCDTSQPRGYCTVFNCARNSCPDEAACILFHASLQGCPYSDRGVSRTGRTFCMAWCQTDSDCRQGDGYVCRDPKTGPWFGIDLDDDQGKKVCIPRESINPPVSEPEVAPVCQASDDGGAPYTPTGGSSSTTDAGSDAGADAGADAGSDAGDAAAEGGTDAGADASDAGTDASDAATD